ncbi:MAG: hypothetical protein WC260_03025 [Candidatus Pacearchaeota archaeon]
MAPKKRTKIRYAKINPTNKGFISKFFSKDTEEYNTSDVELLRQALSNQKARILHIIKTKNPQSIYELSKILKRDFKSVYQDLKFLERIGFIDFQSKKTGKRTSLKPILIIDQIQFIISI